MARNLVPYGLLPNGNYGINLDNTTSDPRAAALEILDTLPSVADPDNFEGRLVFSIADATIFVYRVTPTTQWVALEGVPATIGPADPPITGTTPPVTGSEIPGELYWTTDTQVLFVWDGLQWQAAGGRYATTTIERRYVGDDVTSAFATGASSAVPSELVEVYIDGVRQNAIGITPTPGDGDYSIAGTAVIFVVPPVLDAEVFIRTYETVQISQTARVFENDPGTRTALAPQTDFPVGVAGADPASVFVYVDGVVQVLDTDFSIIQADTTIVSLAKALPGDVIAKAVTTDPHGIPSIGTVVQLGGALESEYNGSFTVIGLPSPTEFEVSVLATDPLTATPDPILFFSPPFIDDVVQFVIAPGAGALVYIKTLKNIVVAPAAGEANSLGLISGATSGRQSIVAPKVGDILQVKGIAPGSNITVSDNGTDLVITAATGANFENRIGANGGLIVPGDTVSYVGVLDTGIPGPPIIVDLSGSGPGGGAPTPGRKITVKDEGGLAGTTRNIQIIDAGGNTFDGPAAQYDITTDRGSVTLVLDSAGVWNITAKV